MLRVYKIITESPPKPIIEKIGFFKSYVAFADWLDENPEQNYGKYHILHPNTRSLAGIDVVIYDGLCTSERRGAI